MKCLKDLSGEFSATQAHREVVIFFNFFFEIAMVIFRQQEKLINNIYLLFENIGREDNSSLNYDTTSFC
jgi:hypothetical protein